MAQDLFAEFDAIEQRRKAADAGTPLPAAPAPDLRPAAEINLFDQFDELEGARPMPKPGAAADLAAAAKDWTGGVAQPPKTRDPGIGQTLAHKFLQGTTKGWSDELVGHIAELLNKSTVESGPAMEAAGMHYDSGEAANKSARDSMRAAQAAADEHHPVLAAGAEMAGDVGSDVLGYMAGAPVAGDAYQTASGAASGLGNSDAELANGATLYSAGKALSDTAFGGAMGYVGGKYVAPAVEAVVGDAVGAATKKIQSGKDALLAPVRAEREAAREGLLQIAEDKATKTVAQQNDAEAAAAAKLNAELQSTADAARNKLVKHVATKNEREVLAADKWAERAKAQTQKHIAAAQDAALKEVTSANTGEIAAATKLREKIKTDIYKRYAKAAKDSGMSPDQAAKALSASESEMAEQIDAEYRKALLGEYAKRMKAGHRAVRDVETLGLPVEDPAKSATLGQFKEKLAQNVDETLAAGVPAPPEKLSPEAYKAEIAKRVKKARAAGVREVKKGIVEIDPAELDRLTDAQLAALRKSGVVPPEPRVKAPAELRAEAEALVQDPEALAKINPKLAREMYGPKTARPAPKKLTPDEIQAAADEMLRTPEALMKVDPALAHEYFAPRTGATPPAALTPEAARAAAKELAKDPDWLARNPELARKLEASMKELPESELAKQLSTKRFEAAAEGDLMDKGLQHAEKLPGKLGLAARVGNKLMKSPADKYAALEAALARRPRNLKMMTPVGTDLGRYLVEDAVESAVPADPKERRAQLIRILNARAAKAGGAK